MKVRRVSSENIDLATEVEKVPVMKLVFKAELKLSQSSRLFGASALAGHYLQSKTGLGVA